MERTAMSDREYLRGEVLSRVVKGDLRLVDAAALLGVSYRQTKRLLARVRALGRKGLVHGNLGKRSNRSHPRSEQERVLAIVAEHYGGAVEGRGQRFGPTLCAEHLFSDHGILVAVPTLRRWMLKGKFWSRVRKTKKIFRRRDRRDPAILAPGNPSVQNKWRCAHAGTSETERISISD